MGIEYIPLNAQPAVLAVQLMFWTDYFCSIKMEAVSELVYADDIQLNLWVVLVGACCDSLTVILVSSTIIFTAVLQ